MFRNILSILQRKKNIFSNGVAAIVGGSYGLSFLTERLETFVSPEMTQTPEFQALISFLSGTPSTSSFLTVFGVCYVLWRVDQYKIEPEK